VERSPDWGLAHDQAENNKNGCGAEWEIPSLKGKESSIVVRGFHRGAALVSFHLPVIPLEKNRSKKPDPGFDQFAILKL